MEKTNWLDFISSRLKTQISLENAEKAQNWGLGFIALVTLAFALQAVVGSDSRIFLYSTKILFLILFHAILALGFYLPNVLRKGEKVTSRAFGIRDFTSFIVVTLSLTFYSIVVLMLSWQVTATVSDMDGSNFFAFMSWMNVILAAGYFAFCLFAVSSLLWFPQALSKLVEKSDKLPYILLGIHAALFVLFGFGYSEVTPLGSVSFFEQVRVAGLFWIFILSSLFLTGRLLGGSSVPSLSELELEIASGRLERPEDILARLKEAFVLHRLSVWIHQLSHKLAGESHQIAQYAHEGMNLVSREKPTELDLRQVDDRYRRAVSLYKKLEKENQRFLLSVSFFDLTQAEQEKVESLRDQFSRETRNANLELASIRKKIDERLISLKTNPPISSEIPIEKVPLSR